MNSESDSPALLKAVQSLLAAPESLREDAESMRAKVQQKNPELTETEVRRLAADKIISVAGYKSGAVGALTALPSTAAPGLGSIATMFGGAAVDATYTVKCQVEMTMKLAVLYGQDIRQQSVHLMCLLVAATGGMQESFKKSAQSVGVKALQKALREYLKGGLLKSVKVAFSKLGITFSRKALEKSAPFFVGTILGFGLNKAMTHTLGKSVRALFESGFLEEQLVNG